MYYFSLKEITSIKHKQDSLVIEGVDKQGKVHTLHLATEDPFHLWFSIERAQRRERLRLLRIESVERKKRGLLC